MVAYGGQNAHNTVPDEGTIESAIEQAQKTAPHFSSNLHSPDDSTTAYSGKALVNWYLSLFSALSTLGTLGAGFTLSVVIDEPPGPNELGLSSYIVTTFAALSSVLFVLTVLVCQGLSQLFKAEQAAIADGIDHEEPVIVWSLAAISLVLQGQVLGAFLFLELVITAHSKIVGFFGIACTSLLGIIALCLWTLQAMV